MPTSVFPSFQQYRVVGKRHAPSSITPLTTGSSERDDLDLIILQFTYKWCTLITGQNAYSFPYLNAAILITACHLLFRVLPCVSRMSE